MNLGQAVAVCLHELVRDSKAAGQTAKTAGATVGELERMTEVLFEVLRVSQYLKPGAVPATEARIRRMVRRMQLSSPDTSEWLGMLRQILWKLRAREPRE
jgi:tRNA/rRNA methyltransferase